MDNILDEKVKRVVRQTLRELRTYSETNQLMQERCRKAIKKAILSQHNDITRLLYCMAVKQLIKNAHGNNFSLLNVQVMAQKIYADNGIDDLE